MSRRSSNRRPALGKPRSLYGIFRVDLENKHAWIVRIQRRKQIWNRHFTDKRHGGKAAALRAATSYRDELLRKHPPLTLAQYVAIDRVNNRSGMAGVCRCVGAKLKGDKTVERPFWLAFWTVDSRRKSAKFYVNVYGEKGAFKLACETRKRVLMQTTGTYVNSTSLREWIRTHRPLT